MSKLLCCVAGAVIIAEAVFICGSYGDYLTSQNRINTLEIEVKVLQQENEDLRRIGEQIKTDEFTRNIVRSKFIKSRRNDSIHISAK